MSIALTLAQLRQHELVILRRLRGGPLTEFELAREIAEHSGYSVEQAAARIKEWLDDLRDRALIWAGQLTNQSRQAIYAAALTRRGRELVD